MGLRKYRIRRKRKYKIYKKIKRKQKGGLFGFEYLMNKLAGRKQHPNNSLAKALENAQKIFKSKI